MIDTGADETITAPFSVLQDYYDGIPGLPNGLQSALSQAPSPDESSCTMVIPCDLILPDLDLYIGNGKATIPGRFLTGRKLGHKKSPTQSNGMNVSISIMSIVTLTVHPRNRHLLSSTATLRRWQRSSREILRLRAEPSDWCTFLPDSLYSFQSAGAFDIVCSLPLILTAGASQRWIFRMEILGESVYLGRCVEQQRFE